VFRCGLVVPQGGITGMNGEGGGMASLYLLGTFPVLRSISADGGRGTVQMLLSRKENAPEPRGRQT
jgi:hypothetical protein